MKWRSTTIVAINLAAATLLLPTALLGAENPLSRPVDFQEQIAPLLVDRCLSCHNAEQAKGGLDLSSGKSMLTGGDGGASVEPGEPDGSLLLEMVSPPAVDQQPEMPKESRPLSSQQIALLRRWIAEGAVWPPGLILADKKKADKSWWSLVPLAELKPPDAEGIPPAWRHHAIDRFVYAQMARRGLRPSPPAEKRTLIRRATFDLIGLPPTPPEIEAFLADDSASAYEKLIDRLLDSPQYGQRWGRHWLDVIRFGESSGYERNHLRDNAWPFRDYVIESFNQDKPFDRFMMEHLAGDQLAPGDPRVEVGTGFLVAGSYDDVGNKDPAAGAIIRANTLDDIISATGTAFLGLTVNCTRCHDHKFDPLEQADYYRLQSAFAGVQQGSRVLAAADAVDDLAARRGPLDAELDDVNEQLAALRRDAGSRVKQKRDELIASLFPRPVVSPVETVESFQGVAARFVRFTIQRTTSGKSGVVLDEFEVWTAAEDPQNVALQSAGAKATAGSSRSFDGDPTFYGPQHTIDGRFGKFWVSAESGGRLTIELARTETISRVVFSNDRINSFGGAARRPFADEYLVEVSLDGQHYKTVASNQGRKPYQAARLNELLLLAVLAPAEREQYDLLAARQQRVQGEINRLPKLPTAWIGSFTQPRQPTYLMVGGDPAKHGDDIAPGGLSALDEVVPSYRLPLNASEGERRLALAKWIVHPDNPLTPRVLANRIWHYHFGRGIVATPSDFGYNGARPTHPLLLDYLGGRLTAGGWRIKPMHRWIMASQTYRQSSRYDAELAKIDTDAAYLWRFPPRRLEAEAVRDSILAIAGKLDDSLDGPGFRLYHYIVDNVATYVPLDRVGSETYRRAVYHQNPRSVKVDMLAEYDLPDCSLSAPRRLVTTSPLQALALQNHSFTIDMARSMAQRLCREAGSDDEAAQVRRAYLLALGRSPQDDELSEAVELIRRHGLVVFCRAIFNANEFVYVH